MDALRVRPARDRPREVAKAVSAIASPDEQQKLAEIGGEVSEVVARARAIEVENPRQAEEATGLLAEIKARKDRSERARKFLIELPTLQVKRINAAIKETTAPLAEADALVRRKVLRFREMQEREREREQARLDEERRVAEEHAAAERRTAWEAAAQAERTAETAARTREEERQLADQAARARQAAEEAEQRSIATRAAPTPRASAPAPLAAGNGSAAVRREWRATVVDISQVPREYLKVDQTAINAAVKAGAREIAGVRIEQVAGLAVRAR